MKYSLREEIARSHQTVDNDPIQYDDHEEVNVEMYGNDEGQWSVKVDCTSDPSLSFPMQKFPDQASADHYARQCSDRIIRKKMNESKGMKKYSLVEQIYDGKEILTEGILEWIAGLIGQLIDNWAKSSGKTTSNTKQEIDKAANEKLREEKPDQKFEDMDMSKNENRVILFKCQANYEYSKMLERYSTRFDKLKEVDQWFVPDDEGKAKEWNENEGKLILGSIYEYAAFCQGEIAWWEILGSEETKQIYAAAEKHTTSQSDTYSSSYKWLQYIKSDLNKKCGSVWNYASGTLKVEEAKEPLELHTKMLAKIDEILPILKKATEDKAAEAPEYLKNRPDEEGMQYVIQSLKDETNGTNVNELVRHYINRGRKFTEEESGKLATDKQVSEMEAFFKQEDWEEKFKSDIELISNFGTETYGKKELSLRNAFIDIYKALSEKVTEGSLRSLVRQLILESLSDDLASVSSGRDAKKKFAQHVDQEEFKKGTIVHWVGSTANLKKIIESPQTKDELSCNFYPPDSHRDWMARGPKKPIGVIIEGWVTYAGKENMFTGYSKRPRKKADRAKYDHRKASSGINKYPYEIWKDEDDYLEHLRNPDVPQTKANEMEPYGVKRDLGDDAWMGSFGSRYQPYQDWNEVLVDNWKITGVVYGGVGRYGLSHRIVDNVKKIARQHGFKAQKMGTMT